MFGTDPIASVPIADTPDPYTGHQGAIIAYVSVQPRYQATSTTGPRENATVTTSPGK